MEDTRAFFPFYAPSTGTAQGALQASVNVSASTSSAASAALVPTSPQIQIANQTTGWAYVNFGVFGNVAAATATSYPVAPGAVVVVTVSNEVTGATVLLSTGTGTVTFTRGAGV